MRDALLIFVLGIAAIHLLFYWNWGKRDDTDSITERSGLILYTDYKTGVQYVGTLFGGITPRLDKSGKPFLNFPEAPKP